MAAAPCCFKAHSVLKLREGCGPQGYVARHSRAPRRTCASSNSTPPSCHAHSTSAVNTNYAVEASLDPVKDLIRIAPYANVIAVCEVDTDDAWAKTLFEAYHDQKIKDLINATITSARSLLPCDQRLGSDTKLLPLAGGGFRRSEDRLPLVGPVTDRSVAMSQRIDQGGQSRRMLSAAGIVEVISLEDLALAIEHFH